jgi:hypothetical protein
MVHSLPKFVPDARASLREEAAPYIGMTPAERAVDLAAACRAGVALLDARPDAERALMHRDPLPESTRLLFARGAHRASREP